MVLPTLSATRSTSDRDRSGRYRFNHRVSWWNPFLRRHEIVEFGSNLRPLADFEISARLADRGVNPSATRQLSVYSFGPGFAKA